MIRLTCLFEFDPIRRRKRLANGQWLRRRSAPRPCWAEQCGRRGQLAYVGQGRIADQRCHLRGYHPRRRGAGTCCGCRHVPSGWLRAPRAAAGRQRSGDRAWAKDHGIAVSARGRIPASVIEQYQAAVKGR